jgi:predicted polyphosphate/ATP-dependent NAD kinase
MKDIFILLFHLLISVAKLLGPGGTKAAIAENLLLKQQLLVVTRSRRRAPNLSDADRFLKGLWSLFLRPGRIAKVAVSSITHPKIILKHETSAFWSNDCFTRDCGMTAWGRFQTFSGS